MNRSLLSRAGLTTGLFLLLLGKALAGPQLEVASQTISGSCCQQFTFTVSPTVIVNRVDLLTVPAGVTVTSATATSPVLATHTATTARWQSSGSMNGISVQACFDGITGPVNLIFEGTRPGTSLIVRDTITITCAPSGCAKIVNEEITCGTDPAGMPIFVWKFQVQNEGSTCQINAINFQNVSGGTLPGFVTFSPAILPGETSTQKTITITGAQPGSIVTVTLQAVGGGVPCCSKDYKITLPLCPPPSGCYKLTVDSIKCTPTAPNASVLFYTLKNTSSIPRCSFTLTSPGGTILPPTSTFSTALQPGAETHLTVVITGLSAGTHTFTGSLCGCPPNDAGTCCVDSFTLVVPDCTPPQPAPCLTTTTSAVFFGMISGGSGSSTLTIVNSSTAPRFYSITGPSGSLSTQYTFTPATFTLQPGQIMGVTITVTPTDPQNPPPSFIELCTVNVYTATGMPICNKELKMEGGFIQTSSAALSSNATMMIMGEEEGILATSIVITNSGSSPLSCAFDLNSLAADGAYDLFRPVTLADTAVTLAANSSLKVKFLFHSDNPLVRPKSIRAHLSREGEATEEIGIAMQNPEGIADPQVTATGGRVRVGGGSHEYEGMKEGRPTNPSVNLGLVPTGDLTFTTAVRCLPGIDSTTITAITLENADGSPIDPAITITTSPPLPTTLLGQSDSLLVTVTAPEGSLENTTAREKGTVVLGKSSATGTNNARLVIHGDDGGDYDPQTGAVRPVGTLGITVGQTERPGLDEIRGGTEFAREGIHLIGVVNPTDGKLFGKSVASGTNNARGTMKDQAVVLGAGESPFRVDPGTFPLEIPPHGIAFLPVEYTGSTNALALGSLTLYLEGGDSLSTELNAIGNGTTAVQNNGQADGRRSRLILEAIPQPASGVTTIDFFTEKSGGARLELFDVRGVQVSLPIGEARVEAGFHSLMLDLSTLPAGTYYCTLRIGDEVTVRPLVIAP